MTANGSNKQVQFVFSASAVKSTKNTDELKAPSSSELASYPHWQASSELPCWGSRALPHDSVIPITAKFQLDDDSTERLKYWNREWQTILRHAQLTNSRRKLFTSGSSMLMLKLQLRAQLYSNISFKSWLFKSVKSLLFKSKQSSEKLQSL